ncbi:hypothetical protein FVE85_3578 [Porphyridium purpureum]|uniref:Uncharacterized protein n=1 Tax=Porphyridium purpureum TaxID=35688 RepID=A0A5J4YMH1_PORPP|nr:hypothetical protein FVE85_3578 [Porphyridium purpureum]|eukprot:POR8140..scf249_10
MAFVQGAGMTVAAPRVRGAVVCSMSSEQAVTRRAVVVGVGASVLAAFAAPVLAKTGAPAPTKPDLSLEQIKKLEEDLKYEEELLQNPEAAMKMKTNIKKKEKEPEYLEDEKNQLLKEKERYQKAVQRELEEEEALAKKFKKNGM